jgi:hypothetical protein
MRSTFGHVTLIVVLVAAGWVLWRAGQYELGVAEAERRMVTLRYDEAAARAAAPGRMAALMPGETRTADAARHLKAAATYWQGDYPTVAADTDQKLLAANAAFRTLRSQGGPWQVVVGRLDSLVKSYADVLRQDPSSAEAAFNYEYAVRLRAAVTQRRQPLPAMAASPESLTVHGWAGAPPEESDAKKFKVIVPMRPDERLEAERAGKGTTKVRKG